MTDYSSWFQRMTRRSPYRWQIQLATSVDCADRLIRIPTGFGKTLGVLGSWAYHRIHRNNINWPNRLVWMLPMRVLVEQTEQEAKAFLQQLGVLWDRSGEDHTGKVGVHTLMGGTRAEDWHLWPECPAVLVGTQDMLLSRALNRGYGAARARWPSDFGLLSQDALWVLDEVQLMDVGLATAAQLAAFRKADAHRSLRPACTWAMSATFQRNWVEKSPDTADWVAGLTDHMLDDLDRKASLWTGTTKPLMRLEQTERKGLAATILERHAALRNEAPLTLAVMNTVDRAKELYLELLKLCKKEGPALHLIHSRFRGYERRLWRDNVLAASGSRIIIATQVVEAGVDLSADFLVTEVCPWPSLVQRLGRLARRGGRGEALVLDVDRRRAAPYEADDLDATWDALGQLADGSPRELQVFEQANPELLPGLYPYEPAHLILREEVEELFDTTPDLSGADLDISRYIRTGDERDVSVFWLETKKESGKVLSPEPKTRPERDGLVAVPFLQARDWLFGKGTKGSEPRVLRKNVHAWVWDYIDGVWRTPLRSDLWPGQTVLVDRDVGGYSLELGWDPDVKQSVSTASTPPAKADAQEETDAAQDNEELSECAWQTIAYHGAEVGREAGRIANALLGEPRIPDLLRLAGRWHDLGKAHPAFQGAIVGAARPDRQDLAKAPREKWRRQTPVYRMPNGKGRAGFRHELASLLALFAILERHAEPEHPSRLGDFAELCPDAPRAQGKAGVLEAELLALPAGEFDLFAYLVCCHHGKLRARLHASPDDQQALAPDGTMPIRGVQSGDRLPATELLDADGRRALLPEYELRLDLAGLGLSPRSGRSWSERVNGLLERFGPFTLAFLESLIRAADVRASRNSTLVDEALMSAKRAP